MRVNPQITDSLQSKLKNYDEVYEIHLNCTITEEKVGKVLTPLPTNFPSSRCPPPTYTM